MPPDERVESSPKKKAVAILCLAGLSLAAAVAWWMTTPTTSTDQTSLQVTAPPVRKERDAHALRTAESDARTPTGPDGATERVEVRTEGRDRRAEDLLAGSIVESSTGAPIAGAEISLFAPTYGDWEVFEEAATGPEGAVDRARSDASGRFEFSVRPGARHGLRIAHDDFAPRSIPHAYGGQDLRIGLSRGGTVAGVVLVDGAAAPGALLRFRTRTEGTLEEVRTAAGGRFGPRRVRAGQVLVEVVAADAAAEHGAGRRRIEVEDGGHSEVEFRLTRAPTTAGRVVDAETGDPIAGAEVSPDADYERRVITDHLGQFRLSAFPTDFTGWFLRARAPGYGESVEHSTAGGDENEFELRLDFALRRAGSVSGRIVDVLGRPLAGVRVAAISDGVPHPGWRVPLSIESETDASGRYLLAGIAKKRSWQLVVRRPGFGTKLYGFYFTPSSAAAIVLPDVALSPGTPLRGRTVDAAGEPVPGVEVRMLGGNDDRDAWVDAAFRDYAPDLSTRITRSGPEGRFVFADVAAGTYRLHGSGGSGTPTSVAVVEGRETPPVDLVVTRPGTGGR
jgi:hypothetical protein